MNEQELFSKALSLASTKHCGQMRRDNTPYIYHPIAVAMLVKNAGYGIPYQVVALLHDVLEDTDTTANELAIFGEDIVEAVSLLSRPSGADETEYVANILANPLASVVKNADKIHNLWDMPFIEPAGTPRSEKSIAFGLRYIEKANLYYKGKFSPALDATIEKVTEFLKDKTVCERQYPCFTSASMKLYVS